MQVPKIIDVTRSFIPVDPNAYPETLHGTDNEDAPEHRFPVIPYMGYNFLPTSYGQRSFFGTNAKILIDSLNPNKPQFVFIFQTTTYKNIIIALCDTGIWAKDITTGAWTHLITLIAIADGTYYEWFFATVKNKLYCFRSNGNAFYKIETDTDEDLDISVISMVPSFITLSAQLGMFRLGNRIAFWDAENAVAIPNPDDFTDFTPSIITGANITTFSSIVGKISSVRTHGKNAICYATKSITFLEVTATETFFVKAQTILGKAGVAYAKQSVASVPDTIHFCLTDSGIYKIQNGTPEVIVPEVYDFFKGYTLAPVYLELLSGRFLCFEVLDPDLINGKTQFSIAVIPGASVTFPGSMPTSLEDLVELAPEDINICDATSLATENFFIEQQDDGNTAVPPSTRTGGLPQPMYTAYLSLANGPVQPIVWGTSPCGSSPFTPSPTGNGGKLSTWSTDDSNKTTKAGTDVWLDGKWTIQRFVQYQSAVWKAQEKAMESFIAELVDRSETESLTAASSTCTPATTHTECTIGRYPLTFSDYQFGFNKCSFWLTRYALSAVDVINTITTTITCSGIQETLSLWRVSGHDWGPISTTGYIYSSAAAAAAAAQASYESIWGPTSRGPYILGSPTLSPGGNAIVHLMTATVGGGTIPGSINRAVLTSFYNKTTTRLSKNAAIPVEDFGIVPESGYCLLTHWKYVDVNGNEQTAVASTCIATEDKYPGSAVDSGHRQVPNDAGRDNLLNPTTGTFCSVPYESSPYEPVIWEDQTVNFPKSSFLLQNGSLAPIYPTKYGAFVYDLHLKKWGKYKLEYKCLLDYSPVNTAQGVPVNFDFFGILAGVHKSDGFLYIFDDNPSNSLITWGKIGYYRGGITSAQEVRFDFASVSAGEVIVDISLDGKNVASDLTSITNFNGVTVIAYPPYDGKWFNVSLSGKWDVSFMEFIGFKKGRR